MTIALLDSAPPLAWLEETRTAMARPFDPAELSAAQLREASRELGGLRAVRRTPRSRRAWHHHHVHANDTETRNQDGRIQFRISGIWKTNHRYRP